jgi:hypothetical protein
MLQIIYAYDSRNLYNNVIFNDDEKKDSMYFNSLRVLNMLHGFQLNYKVEYSDVVCR